MSLLLLFVGASHLGPGASGGSGAGTLGKIRAQRISEKEFKRRREKTPEQQFDEILAERRAALEAERKQAETERDLAYRRAIDAQIAAVEALKAQILAPLPQFTPAKPEELQLQHLINSQVIANAKALADDEDEAIAVLLMSAPWMK